MAKRDWTDEELKNATVLDKIKYLPWFVWVVVLGMPVWLGTEYFLSKWDGEPFHPVWIRGLVFLVALLILGFIIKWVIASEHKRNIKLGDKTPNI